jgi:hypothetical protein
MNNSLSLSDKFALCLQRAKEIVAEHRAEAPPGCDPQAAGVAIGAAIIGAGASIYSAQQAKKGSGQARSNSELSNLPVGQQLKYANGQAKLQYKWNALNANQAIDYAPLFAKAQADAAQELLKLYPSVSKRERQMTTAQRAADLADFTKMSPGWSEQLSKASPAYAAMQDQVRQGEGSPMLDYLNAQAFNAGPSDLRTELERQALYELQLGGELTPEEERLATQQARGAYGDRGMLYGNPAIGAEVLNRDAMSRARLDQRRQFGALAQGIGFNEDQGNRQFGLNVQGQNEASQGNFRNFLLGSSQATLNPQLQMLSQRASVRPDSVLGMYAGSSSPQTWGAVQGSAPSIAQGVQSLQGLYNYAGDVNNTNFNAAESRANQQANAYAAAGSGLMSAGTQMYATNRANSAGAAGPYGSTYTGDYLGKPVYRPQAV